MAPRGRAPLQARADTETDFGIAPVAAAGLLSTMGFFDLLGTTASGWLTDRHDPRRLGQPALRAPREPAGLRNWWRSELVGL